MSWSISWPKFNLAAIKHWRCILGKNKNGARVQGTWRAIFQTTGGLLILTWKTTAEIPDSPAVLYKSMQGFGEQLTSSLCPLKESSQEWTYVQVASYMLLAYNSSISPWMSSLHIEQKLIELGCVTCNRLHVKSAIRPIYHPSVWGKRWGSVAATTWCSCSSSAKCQEPTPHGSKKACFINWLGIHSMIMIKNMVKSNTIK